MIYAIIVRTTTLGATSWRVLRVGFWKTWRTTRSVRVTTANRIFRASRAEAAGLPVRRTVWIAGSYGDEDTSPGEREYARRVAQRLGAELARSNINAVVGESDLLLDLCNAFRSSSSMSAGARALMVHGSLRIEDPVGFLASLVAHPPTGLIVIGGSSSGRTSQEARLARQSNLPVAAFIRSGGAAARLRTAFALEDGEPSDAVAVCLGWIQIQEST